MTCNWRILFILFLGLFLFSACGSVNKHRGPAIENTEEEKGASQDNPNPSLEMSTQATTPAERGLENEGQTADGPLDQKLIKADQSVTVHPHPGGNQPATSQPHGPTNQELLDSALDFCQVSNDFWERGDLDNALDALDKAYSLILKVDTDDDPDVLQQKEDLRFTVAKRIIEVYASRITVANGNHNAIPLQMNAHVKRALDLFTGREKQFFLNAYRRSGRYRPAIVKALNEAGLPEELSWLPLIESGFKIRALSRARALGLWQFIASTGYKFGLKRDYWIDERMDVEKSTMAAIAYLKELHQIFGDWTTVLAAYNCGEWAVLKRIKTQKINYLDNFWDLYEKLPRETAFYVPRFMAMLYILKDPEAHGMELPPLDEEIKTEEITINKQVHLQTVAKSLDVDYGLLREMNAELRQNFTPSSPYSLKVPVGLGKTLLAELDNIPVWHPPVPAYVTYKVQSGDSLSVIAQRHKTSVRAIMAANDLKRSNYLKVGWKLRIPTKRTYVAQRNTPQIQASKISGKTFEYVVKQGDSLWLIANRFGTTTNIIRSLNQLNSSLLSIGQVLEIPLGPTSSEEPGDTQTYRVQRGDSPYLIAKRFRMNLADLLKLNQLTPRSTIFPGQVLILKAN